MGRPRASGPPDPANPETTLDEKIGTTIAGCTIERELGRGGMGVVYLATQTSLGRQVALKLISPQYTHDDQFRARFERESRMAAVLEHPHVVPVYEAGEAENLLYMIMRYVPGTDVGAVIRDEGRLEPMRAVTIVEQIAGALDEAHELGLVHRDVKPANILLAPRRGGGEHAYLTDFGLTKQTSSESGLTGTGMMVGTLDYIAPEQLSGGQISARTDVYALACVLFHAMAGQVPFPQPDTVSKMFAHAHEPRPALDSVVEDVPHGLSEAIQQGMSKEPDERFASTGEFAEAARKAVGGSKGTLIAPVDPTAVTDSPADLQQTRVQDGIAASGAPQAPAEPPVTPPPAPVTPAPGPVTPPPGQVTPPPVTPPPGPQFPPLGQVTPPPGPQPPIRATATPAGAGRSSNLKPLLAVLGVAAVLILVAVFALAGGGGDDGGGGGGDDGGDGGGAATFVAAAEEICGDQDELDDALEIVDDFADTSSPTQLPDVVRELDSYIDDSEDALGDLQELEPPDDARADWTRYLEAREAQIGEVQDIRDEAERRRTTDTTFEQDSSALKEAVDDAAFDESTDEVNAAAEGAGVEACSV